MTDEVAVDIVKIRPDWEMLFFNDELVLEGHSVDLKDALTQTIGENIVSVDSHSVSDADDVDGIDRRDEASLHLRKNGLDPLR